PTCAGTTPALTVTIAPPYVLTYATHGATSIKPGDVVEFKTESVHDATSGSPPGTPDGIFRVDFNKDQCLKFTVAGDFPFYCSFPRFPGPIRVKGAGAWAAAIARSSAPSTARSLRSARRRHQDAPPRRYAHDRRCCLHSVPSHSISAQSKMRAR